MKLFQNDVPSRSLVDHLYHMAAKDPKNLILSSSSTRLYMSLDKSVALIEKWLLIQLGDTLAKQFIDDIYAWITKKDYKRGGFYMAEMQRLPIYFYNKAIYILSMNVDARRLRKRERKKMND